MKFSEVAQFFEEISKHTSRIEITKLLAQLFEQTSPHEAQIISYLTLGTLRAMYRGTQFNLAEKSVTKIVADLLDEEPAAVTRKARSLGDLGLVVAQGKWHHKENLSVLQVYEALGKLEYISGTGAQEEKAHALHHLLKSVDHLSALFIIRIVLGKLRLGFSDMTLLDSFSWMLVGNKSLHERIENAYNVCADIGIIAYTLKEKGIDGLDEVHIIIGVPIRPAAAERMPTARDIMDKIGPCVAQPKLDGFRLQVHIDNRHHEHKIWFFSRNLLDMSAMFPDLAKALKKVKVETLIAEGEAIGYNEETESFVPFQETVTRKRKYGIEEAAESVPLKLFFFDILYLNGEPLLNKAHHTRRDILIHVFKNVHDPALSIDAEKQINTVKELEDYFLYNIESGLEGLVMKKPNAHYQPGKRNFNWIKLKRQAEGHLEDTIDVVILGYYLGKGKRALFGIGAFLVGIYDKKKDVFETIAKIGTGLKDQDWKDLKKKCDQEQSKHQPHNIICAKELFPDVWVNPAIVCSIRADEITLSPLHSAGKTAEHPGFALRFPRFIAYRPDKSERDTTTLDEIKKLYHDQTYKKIA
ncbi:MAG: ATP-dependent DNA ligase [Candidatus Babeliaceae bacterium]